MFFSFHFRRLLAPNIQKREFLKEGATSISQQVRISWLSLWSSNTVRFQKFWIFIQIKSFQTDIFVKTKNYIIPQLQEVNNYSKSIFALHLQLKGLIDLFDKKVRQNYYLVINVSVLVIHTQIGRPFEMTSSVLDCFEMCVKQKKAALICTVLGV